MGPGIVTAIFAEARILSRGPIAPGEVLHLPEGALMLLSGMGADRARLAARFLLEKKAAALVSWGSAGGLLPGLSAGSLILPERIIASDQSVYRVDPIWHERLSSQLKGYLDLHKGALAESPVVLATCGAKSILFGRTGAIAVDMESASIALVAKEAGIPFAAIRAVTDAAEMNIPRSALSSIDEFGRVRLSRLLLGLVRRPVELRGLVRLGRNFQAARATLTTVARHAGSNLLFPWIGEETVFRQRTLTEPAAQKGKKP